MKRNLIITIIALGIMGVFGQQLFAFASSVNAPRSPSAAGVTFTTPASGLITREYSNLETFFTGSVTMTVPKSQTYIDVVLDMAPTGDVTLPFGSSDTSEGVISPASLTFTPANWDEKQRITISSVDDNIFITETIVADDTLTYTVVTSPAQSSDPAYNLMNPVDFTISNLDNEINSREDAYGTVLSIENIGHSNNGASPHPNRTTFDIVHDLQGAQELVDESGTIRSLYICTNDVLDDFDVDMDFIPDPDFPSNDYNSLTMSTSISFYGANYEFGSILPETRVEHRHNFELPIPFVETAEGITVRFLLGSSIPTIQFPIPTLGCGNNTLGTDLSLVDTPPVGVDDSYNTADIEVLHVAGPQGVLANDTESGEASYGRPLRAKLIMPPSNGRIHLLPDGGFIYTPTVTFNGVVSFTYQAYQNQMVATSENTVSITVNTQIPNDLYVATTAEGCYPAHPCLFGNSSLQDGINYVPSGGMVTLLDAYTATMPITAPASILVAGRPGNELIWDGGVGSLFQLDNGGNVMLKGVNMRCDTNCVGATAINHTAGTLNTYANNVVGFGTAYAGTGAQLGQNWWGTANGANPGVPASDWAKRLGAPVVDWADGAGSAQLGDAQLGNGSGTAVIVSHGRSFPDGAPFGVGIAGQADQMCSDYYDFFVRGGSGSWQLTLPVDNTAACNSETLAAQQLFFATDIADCDMPDNSDCWDLVETNVSTNGQTLVVSSLSSAQLGGTPVVAGNGDGNSPTAVSLQAISATNTAVMPMLLFVMLALMGGTAVYVSHHARLKLTNKE